MKIDGIGPFLQPEPKDKKPEKTQKPAACERDMVEIRNQDEKFLKPGYDKNVARPGANATRQSAA
jgi:hypothetical protein